MLRETLSQTHLLELPIFAFLVFFVTFVFVVVRVMAKKKNDPQIAAMAAMPLEDDTHVTCESDKIQDFRR